MNARWNMSDTKPGKDCYLKLACNCKGITTCANNERNDIETLRHEGGQFKRYISWRWY